MRHTNTGRQKNALSGREWFTISAAFATRPVRSIYYSVTAFQPSVSPIQGGPPSRWKALTFSQQHNQATPTATHPRFPIGRCTQRRRTDHVLLTHVYKQAHNRPKNAVTRENHTRVLPLWFQIPIFWALRYKYLHTTLHIFLALLVYVIFYFVKHKTGNNKYKWTPISYLLYFN